MKRYLQIIFAAVIIFCGNICHSEVMTAPNLNEGISKSDAVLLCIYSGYENRSDIQYLNPPEAILKSKEILFQQKNETLTSEVKISYALHDGSSCEEVTGFKFKSSIMPKEGSEWILLLQKHETYNIFYTYRGNFGRLPATPENLQKIKPLIKAKNNQK